MVKRAILRLMVVGCVLCVLGVTGFTLLGAQMPAQEIAFTSNRDGTLQIYRMDIERGSSFKLTHAAHASNLAPTWSPDGQSIAFTSLNGSTWDLYIMNATGRDVRRLTHGPRNNQNPHWSPDGTQIAFSSDRDGDWDIYVMDLATGTERALTDNSVTDEQPAWSPDGQDIAFVSRMNDDQVEVYLIGADGSNLRRLTYDSAREATPQWSPDGQRLIWVTERAPNNPCKRPTSTLRCNFALDIYTMDTQGRDAKRITTRTGTYWMPSFSVDTGHILFASGRGAKWNIYLMAAGSETRRRLTWTESRENFPVWRPS